MTTPHPHQPPAEQLIHGLSRQLRDQQLRILLVDESESFRQETSRSLNRQGWQVIESSCVQDAISRFCPDSIDIIITSDEMPDMSGIVLMQTLHLDCPNTPVVITTSHDEDAAAVVNAIRDGAVDMVAKTGGDVALIAAVRRAGRVAAQQRQLKHEIAQRKQAEASLRMIHVARHTPDQ